MEAMRQDFETGGFAVDVVAINIVGAESTQALLTSICTFDLLQDVEGADVWTLMGGKKDDMFIYRQGGVLAPSGYLDSAGSLSTDLSSAEGYENVYNAVVAAHDLGAGTGCSQPAGELQLPGDANQDHSLDIADAIVILTYLFGGTGETLVCEKGADVNDSGKVDIADAIGVLAYVFADGVPPVLGTICVPMIGCPASCAR